MKKCPYCAEEIQDDAIKCKHCGEYLDKKKVEHEEPEAKEEARKKEEAKTLQTDEQFCSTCGAIVKKVAEICPKCGVRIKVHEEYKKSKAGAVILALLFGGFSWIYTWKADKAKFIGVLLFTLLTPIAIAALTEGEATDIPSVLFLLGAIIWVCAIIQALVRPQQFYKNY